MSRFGVKRCCEIRVCFVVCQVSLCIALVRNECGWPGDRNVLFVYLVGYNGDCRLERYYDIAQDTVETLRLGLE